LGIRAFDWSASRLPVPARFHTGLPTRRTPHAAIAVDVHRARKTIAACSHYLMRSFGPSGRPPTVYR